MGPSVRILFITNASRAGYAGRSFDWLGARFAYASFTFESLVRFRRAPDLGAVVHRRQLELALEELTEYDGILSEEPETVLLAYVARRRGLPAKRWLVNVVQRFARAGSLRAATERTYGEDPLVQIASDPRMHWVHTTSTHRSTLLALGLPAERLHFVPATSAIQEHLFPDSARALAAGKKLPLPAPLGGVAGGVLLAGTNNRDLATAAAAAELLGRPVHALTDIEGDRRPSSPWLAYHPRVSLEHYIAAVAHAGVLLVPVLPGEESCGQQTLAAAQRVGTVVAASDVPAIRDYVEHGVSGFLAEPANASALAAAIQAALAHAGDPAILAAAQARDARDAAVLRGVFERAFALSGA
jgi:hypothetical protein